MMNPFLSGFAVANGTGEPSDWNWIEREISDGHVEGNRVIGVGKIAVTGNDAGIVT